MVLAGLFAVAPPPGVAAQTPSATEWATLEQRVDLDMSAGDGSADVVIRYRFGPGEEGAPLPTGEPLTFELLGYGAATVGEIELLSGDATRRIVLWPTVGSHRVGVVEPPFEVVGDALTMTASYRIGDALTDGEANPVHARVPILTGPAVRAESGGQAFQARLTVPDTWAVSEGFPSGLRSEDDDAGDGSSGESVHVVSLTVAPSVVAFRAATDGRWRPGFPLLVDVLTVLILASFIGAGWRHLRSVAA